MEILFTLLAIFIIFKIVFVLLYVIGAILTGRG